MRSDESLNQDWGFVKEEHVQTEDICGEMNFIARETKKMNKRDLQSSGWKGVPEWVHRPKGNTRQQRVQGGR